MFSYNEDYEIYLQGSKWGEKRVRILTRDGYKCVVCGSDELLQVHHLTYIHVYEENDDELVTVCRKCHRAFHELDNRRKDIERKYHEDVTRELEEQRTAMIKERNEQIEQDIQMREATAKKIIEEIQEEYRKEDYAKNGDLDMCSWTVLNPIIRAKCKKYDLSEAYINKNDIKNWFLCRRCELLLRCIAKNQKFAFVRDNTKFDSGWLYKWYNKEKLEAKLKEENFINKFKEEEI